MNSQKRWWIYSDFAISVVNQWEFTKNIGKWLRKLSISFYFCVNSDRIRYFFRVFTSKLLFFRELTFNLLSFPRIHFILRELFTIFYATLLRIHYLLRDFTKTSLSFAQIHFEFNKFFANSLRIRYLLREYTSFEVA